MAYSLEEMEAYLSEIYSVAAKDLEKTARQYLKDFERLQKQNQKKVDNGKWTQEEYDTWRKNKLLYGEHWPRIIQKVQREMLKVNQTAIDYVNGKVPQIFAHTYNEVANKIPKSPVSGYSFELVNSETVNKLVKEEGIMLPPKKNLDKQKDKLWNAKQLNAQILQGVLTGESIPKLAERVKVVVGNNEVAAVRTARTMCTAAENSGRQSAYNKAEADGIKLNKTWLSAYMQANTRDTHRELNEQTVRSNEMFLTFKGNELEFPGDWRAPGYEVYNCRCTMVTSVIGFDKDKLKEAVERQKSQTAQKQQERAEGFVFAPEIEGRSEVEEIMSNITGSEREVWERAFADANYTVLENNENLSDNIAYNEYQTRNIFLYPTSSATTAYHETAHSMDWTACTMEYVTSGKRKFLDEWIVSDPYSIETKGASYCVQTIFQMNDGNDWGKAKREDLVSIYKWANVLYVSDTNPSLAMDLPSSCRDMVKAIRNFATEYGEKAANNLSDMIEATTVGNFPLVMFPGCGGHGENYWKSASVNEYAEGWAEFCQMKAMKQDEAIEAIRQIMPNKINALEEVYNVVFNGGTYEHRIVTEEGNQISEETWRIRVGI